MPTSPDVPSTGTRPPLALPDVTAVWGPLAASWMLMGLELPVVSAVMARLPQPEVSLAAYGGVVFPTALIIESPIIMLLAASTALVRDIQAYRLVRRFMFITAGSLVALHALVAFTPLFDILAGHLLAVPPETREPARIGLRLMLPWVIAIALRRTEQGVLIRSGRPHALTIGTAVRLVSESAVLAAGLAYGRLPGIVVGTGAVACGVTCEAIYAGIAVRPALRELRAVPPAAQPLTMRAFMRFYTPLMVTPLISFLAMPFGAAAMSRMPRPLESLAVWPVLSGASFTMRSLGFAYHEVVVSQLDRWRPVPALRRFTVMLAVGSSAVLLLAAATPVGLAWFSKLAALPSALIPLAIGGLWWLALSPAATAWQSYWQGALLHAHRTRAVTESVVVLLVVTTVVLGAGVAGQGAPGVYFAAAGLLLGAVAQAAWLGLRAQDAIRAVIARDAAS
jgi:hypothetical protein